MPGQRLPRRPRRAQADYRVALSHLQEGEWGPAKEKSAIRELAIRELAAFVANERVSMINLCYPIVEEDKTSVD